MKVIFFCLSIVCATQVINGADSKQLPRPNLGTYLKSIIAIRTAEFLFRFSEFRTQQIYGPCVLQAPMNAKELTEALANLR